MSLQVMSVQRENRGNSMVVRFGSFMLDRERRQLFRGDTHLHLTPKAFELLVLLVTEAPRVLSKPELHQRLWPNTFVSDATIAGLIKELRRALEDRDRGMPIIRTAHGVGYAFGLAVSTAPVPSTRTWHWLVLSGRRLGLGDADTVIGRDGACDIHLDHPSVSRRHARILIDSGGTHLEDLGSKNGTTVRGRVVDGLVAVQPGDRIVFGSVVAVYRRSGPGDSTQTRTRPASAG
jgi:DNA-binding winged helix-turn-helix (wHTH) protein